MSQNWKMLQTCHFSHQQHRNSERRKRSTKRGGRASHQNSHSSKPCQSLTNPGVIPQSRWAGGRQGQLGLRARQASPAPAADVSSRESSCAGAAGGSTPGTNGCPLLLEGNVREERLGKAGISGDDGLHPTWPGDMGFLIGLLQSQSL